MKNEPKRLIELCILFRWTWDSESRKFVDMTVWEQHSDYRSGEPGAVWFTWQPQFGLTLLHMDHDGFDHPCWIRNSETAGH